MLTYIFNRLLPSLMPVFIGFFINTSTISAQNLEIDSLGFETFEMTDGDTTYLMKKYFIVYLKKGPIQDHSPDEASKIQEGHRANMKKLAADGSLCIAGPMADDGNIRGIMILSVPTLQEVERMVAKDPAVIAGRLIMEVQPFWAAKGSKLY